MTEKANSIATVGQSLVSHAQSLEMDGTKRGLVVELFPAIFAAHERMSARAISRFLQEQHGIKISVVTISKALNDPKRYWNLFFDTIEAHVATYEHSEFGEKRAEFLYNDKAFKKIEFPGRETVRKLVLKYELAHAIDVLREKWFSIDRETRLKARPYLAERLIGKEK